MRNWVKPYTKKYKFQMALALFCGLLGVGSGAMLLFVSGYLISKSALQPENIMIVYVPIVAVRAFSVGQASFLYVEKLVSHDLVLKILEKMRTKLYRVIEPQALFLRSRYKTGDLLGVLSDDIEHLQDLYLRTILPGALSLVIYGIIIAVLGFFNLPFAIMMALMLGILVFLVPILSFRVMRPRHLKVKRQRNKLYAQFTDAIFGLSDWQASGRTEEFFTQVNKQNEQLHHTERSIQRWHHVRDGILQLAIGLIIIAMIIWSSLEVEQATFTPTLIAAFTLMIFSITDALKPMSDAIEHLPVYTDSINRIKQVEQNDTSVTDSDSASLNTQEVTDIHIDQLSYKYPNSNDYVLSDLSLHIPAGKKVAILGRSGTGKSTLLKLLAGALKPSLGTIKIQDTEMSSHLLAKVVSVMNQKPHLFSTSIANNIRIGQPEASDAAVMKAAEHAQLLPLIQDLPEGIHTHMREMGSRFSGGERQRIALARVLLQDTPILLIDEATVGLDPKTEQALLETILSATTDKTVIWITHHLAHIESMDEVIFLKDGHISMQGHHKQLLKSNAHYKKLYEMDQGL